MCDQKEETERKMSKCWCGTELSAEEDVVVNLSLAIYWGNTGKLKNRYSRDLSR